MNVSELEALVRSADLLRNYPSESKGDQVHSLLLDRVSAELGKVETSEELSAALKSSEIKQANINLLAGKILDFEKAFMNGESWGDSIKSLAQLAESLRQEEPNTTAAVVN